jgi:hypothetical protein
MKIIICRNTFGNKNSRDIIFSENIDEIIGILLKRYQLKDINVIYSGNNREKIFTCRFDNKFKTIKVSIDEDGIMHIGETHLYTSQDSDMFNRIMTKIRAAQQGDRPEPVSGYNQ